jgi:methanogenic corrinoid protein MtbC1
MEFKGVANECKIPPAPLPGADQFDAWDEEAARLRSQHGARLEDLVRERIVPRLVLLHKDLPEPASMRGPMPEDIVEFGRLVIGSDPTLATEFAERMRERGISSEVLFETLLAPTARHLGELWEEDICDFVEVGLGVGRLQTLLGELSQSQMVATDLRRRALLISTQRDQHVFGLDIVASFLRTSGWDTFLEKGLSVEENARTAAGHWFAVAGVTMSRESSFDSVARVIVAVRRASVNPAISIMVGGVAFTGRPDLVVRVGADAAANDGPGAALLAQRLYLRQTAAAPVKAMRHAGQRAAGAGQARL